MQVDIRFDHGPDGAAELFSDPQDQIVAWSLDDVPDALDRLDQAQKSGAWLAGFASYELGYALEPRLKPLLKPNRRLPLLMFGLYDRPGPAPALQSGAAALSDLTPDWDADTYARGFQAVHDYICAGDTYQVNLTFPIRGRAQGDVQALYRALTRLQPVQYGALVQADGLPAILSRSPELFFRTDADGMIETRPMKGTQPRSSDPVEDAARAVFLKSDEKNQAENLMIVDLLRNDISRICEVGSVHVPELFTVESYETVHQMVSLIRGQMQGGTRLSDILRALFPCGSITGAPKLRAMEIIAKLEPNPRDIYCGSIGWMAPDGRSEFNVAIRTLLLDGDDATLNVGGGLVYDSTAASEYEEAMWKAKFASQLDRKF
nr:aminodeoxychorismate synthase component I [Aliiroseovarius sp. F20344]